MKQEYGFQVFLDEPIFNDIIAKGLGLPPGSIKVAHVSNDFAWRSVRLVIVSNDPAHPLLVPGCEPVQATLEYGVEQIGDGECRKFIKGVKFE